MADTLISPAVGGAMWAATAGVAAYSIKKLKDDIDERKAPLMGVLGAFVFAAQMINFSIPGTGSSGHLGGGMLLAILLGPYAGFLTIASVLVIQALFFADGGLLALGCNIFNLGFFPCFVAFPLIYRGIIGKNINAKRMLPASLFASIVGLQLGAFGVVLETLLSGITELPFSRFVILMQPIHLAIGVVEGIVTAGVVLYVLKAKPDIMEMGFKGPANNGVSGGRSVSGRPGIRKILIVLGALTVLTGGVFSWFASSHPDGLEWSIFHAKKGREDVRLADSGLHGSVERFQERTAFLPDYGLKEGSMAPSDAAAADGAVAGSLEGAPQGWPSIDAGTTLSGVVGALLTLTLAGIVGFFILKKISGGRTRKAAR